MPCIWACWAAAEAAYNLSHAKQSREAHRQQGEAQDVGVGEELSAKPVAHHCLCDMAYDGRSKQDQAPMTRKAAVLFLTAWGMCPSVDVL